MNALRLLALAASSCAASAAFAVTGPVNLLVNGSFESGSASGFSVYGATYDNFFDMTFPATTSSSITGWKASANQNESRVAFTVFTSPGLNEPAPADGGRLLNIGGFDTAKGAGLLWQDFATVAGQTYNVSFFFGRSNNSTSAQNVSVDAFTYDVVSGETSGSALGQVSSGNAAATGAVGTLAQVGFQFTATGATTRLLFDDTSTSALVGGPSLHLDAASVTASAVPEPASFAALAGLGVLGLSATRRRRAAA